MRHIHKVAYMGHIANEKGKYHIYICCYFSDDIDDIDDKPSNPLFSNYNQVASLIIIGTCE